MTPTVIVHGIGRCGSSLAMQMLEAGGWPVVGQYPDYESDEVSPFRQGAVTSRRAHEITVPGAWLGRAMKLIWPAAWGWGGGSPAVVVLATRDPLIQATSQVKLMRHMMPPGFPIDSSRRKLRQLADSNAEDTASCGSSPTPTQRTPRAPGRSSNGPAPRFWNGLSLGCCGTPAGWCCGSAASCTSTAARASMSIAPPR